MRRASATATAGASEADERDRRSVRKEAAFLVDASGSMFQAVDGDIVDGRYRLVRVEKDQRDG
jgi:hypothetical protein